MIEDIQSFIDALSGQINDAAIEIDKPHDDKGTYWIDISKDAFSISVSYRFNGGFGVYAQSSAYGEKPNERYTDPLKAAIRIGQIYELSGQDIPVLEGLCLSGLRQLNHKTQEDIATGMGIRQPSVARLEKRGDMKLSTLQDYVASLGGHLEMRVNFEDMEAPLTIGASRTPVKLALLVLRAKNPGQLARFYGNLGLEFKDEKHGAGPRHKACKLHDSVFEIYPCVGQQPPTTGTRIGFRVSSIDESICQFGDDVEIISAKKNTGFGTRIVLKDPEGHKVELTEMSTAEQPGSIVANW